MWQITQGARGAWEVPAVNACGNPFAYTGAEVLSGAVWPGGNLAPLINLTPTWLDPAQGTTSVSIAAVDSANLDVATYQVLLKVDDTVYYRGELQVLDAPGAVASLPSYCTHADLIAAVSWIDSVQGRNPTGFPQQRAIARQWTDEMIQRHYRGGGGLSRDNYFLPWPQYVPGDLGRPVVVYRSGATSPTLQGWLDAGGLKISQGIREANAYYAIAKVLEGQITTDADNPYKALSREFFGKAENAILLTDAEIDSSGSAYASTTLVVKLGSADTLEG